MKIQHYDQPEFLFCEIYPKDGTMNDHRIWIYHRLSLSLIEFVCLNDLAEYQLGGRQKDYIYLGIDDNADPEAWKGIFVQNNCEATDNDADKVLDRAWQYLENYLKWEDAQ